MSECDPPMPSRCAPALRRALKRELWPIAKTTNNSKVVSFNLADQSLCDAFSLSSKRFDAPSSRRQFSG